jgi:hypothetical protein
MIAAITAISRPGILRSIHRAASTITMTPADTATSAPCTCGSARTMSRSLAGVLLPVAVTPEHVGELPGSHLDADAGEEPDQEGAGQEIRQEPEPGQPGQQQQPAREQGREPGQPDVLLRASGREPGQGRAEYGRGGGVRADGEMAR